MSFERLISVKLFDQFIQSNSLNYFNYLNYLNQQNYFNHSNQSNYFNQPNQLKRRNKYPCYDGDLEHNLGDVLNDPQPGIFDNFFGHDDGIAGIHL